MHYFKRILSLIIIIIVLSNVCYNVAAQNNKTDEYALKSHMFRLYNDKNYYILLDVSKDLNSKYFIIASKDFAVTEFDDSGNWCFDVESPSNIGYKINQKGFIPGDISNYINDKHQWSIDDKTLTAGVSLLSTDEYEKYVGFFGTADDMNLSDSWWLRNADEQHCVYKVNTDGKIETAVADSLASVRPVFYLNNDFFKSVKLDVNTLGSDIKRIMSANYTHSQLADAGYSNEEISLIKKIDVEYTEKITYVSPKTGVGGICDAQNLKFGLKFDILSKKPLLYEVSYTVDNSKVYTDYINVGADSDNVVWFDLPLKKGKFEINIIVKRDNIVVFEDKQAVIYMEDYTPQFMNVFSGRGACAHVDRGYYYNEQDYDFMNKAGIEHIRTEIKWNLAETLKKTIYLKSITGGIMHRLKMI